MTATFACGHTQAMTGEETQPRCHVCGEQRIARVQAPAPMFRGHARGPCAQFEALPPKAVSLG